MAWPVQRTHFWHAFHPTPLPNVALESHKENKCFGLHCPASPVALRFWPGFATISHKNHQILTPNARYLLLRVRRQKKTSRSRETAWPGRFNGPIFDTHCSPPNTKRRAWIPQRKQDFWLALPCMVMVVVVVIVAVVPQPFPPCRQGVGGYVRGPERPPLPPHGHGPPLPPVVWCGGMVVVNH